MALALNDRVQQTGTANTTVSFTLTGSVTGFQSFAVVGNGNTTYYSATDGAGNWEVGIGTYSTTGPTLTRTTILSSSNSNAAVTFSGLVNVFVTYPSGKSVNLDGSNNVSALGTVASGTWQGSTVGVTYGGTGVTSSSGANSVMLRDSNQNVSINRLNQSSTTVSAAGTTTTLTAASTFSQILSGTGGQTFKLPDATTLTNTTTFEFNNNATGTLTIQDNALATVGTVASGGAAAIALLSNSTVAGTWDVHAYIPESVTWGTNALALGSTVITGGTWNGGTITSAYGGTGLTTFTAANNALYSTSGSALAAGTLPIAAGGTAATTFTANGVLYGNGTSALGVTAAGTTGQVLLATTSGAPTWGSVPSTGAVTSITFGSTGLTPSSATTGAVTVAGTLIGANGGTGTATTAVGDLLQGAATNTWSKLAAVATGNALISGGVTTASSWGKIGLTTHVSGTLPIANGGTNLTAYTTGDIVYASATNTLASLADVATGNALISGGVGVAPSYGKIGLTTHVSGTLPVGNGGTNLTTYTTGDILYASAATTIASLADVATGNALISGGVGVAPSYGKIGLTTHVSGTLPIANGGTNSTATATAGGAGYGTGTAHAYTAAGTSGQPLISAGAAAPAFGTLALGTANTNVSGALTVTNGGTGAATLTANGIVYGNGTSAAGITAAGTTGQVLIATTGAAPSWGAVPASGVTSITGTANQITASASTGAVTLSIPSAFTAPGSIAATTTVTGTTINASQPFVVNSKTATVSYSIPSGSSAMSAGPITVNSGVVITVPSGSRWVVL